MFCSNIIKGNKNSYGDGYRMILNRKIAIVILAIIALMLVLVGCKTPNKEAANPGGENGGSPEAIRYDNSGAFKSLKDKLGEMEVSSISIIGVDDMIDNNIDRERQVYQAILQELTDIGELKVIEGDKQELEKFFQEKGVDPSRGLSTDASINLAVLLNVDAIIYGTIESSECDVNIKIYSAKDGGVIFSETIENLKLPIDKTKDKFEIPPGLLEPENQTES